MERLIHEQSCFKVYSLSDRKPVQRPEHRTNMVVLPGSSQDPSSSVLNVLQLFYCSFRESSEKAVTVV